jgi:hypothetical protein
MFGSVSLPVTLAVLVMVPVAVGLTTMVMVASLPGALAARLPRLQAMVLVPLQFPWVEEAETNVTPAGKVSVTVTPVAGCGPMFLTASV